jgi:hypothetical protein
MTGSAFSVQGSSVVVRAPMAYPREDPCARMANMVALCRPRCVKHVRRRAGPLRPAPMRVQSGRHWRGATLTQRTAAFMTSLLTKAGGWPGA